MQATCQSRKSTNLLATKDLTTVPSARGHRHGDAIRHICTLLNQLTVG